MIVKDVFQNGSMSIPDLARLLNVSEVTVRRDLDELDKTKAIERVRGGARRPSPKGPEPSIVQRQMAQVAEKYAIGQAAASLVEDGEVIAILSGSTPQQAASSIGRRRWANLLVVTNGLMICQELIRTPGIRLVLIGGNVYPDELGTFGVLAVDMVKSMRVHRLLTGCRGIDPATGTSNDLGADPEVALVRALANASDQVIVMADHTKLGSAFLIPALPVDDIDVLVTDAGAPASMLALSLNRSRPDSWPTITIAVVADEFLADGDRKEVHREARGYCV
jgi:DeoR/GlpR family transcriptional regulator of sugar metabolism